METKACPFCGKAPDSEAWDTLGAAEGAWRIGCMCMGAYCVRDSKEEAVKVWNNRQLPESEISELAGYICSECGYNWG